MSTEDEFSKWLRRKERTFDENFKFALKSWQSVEFALNSKYELILNWLCDHESVDNDNVVEENLDKLLKLRAQPGLLDREIKEKFVDWCLQQAHNNNSSHNNRKWCDLLALLVEFEPLQDIFRTKYDLLARVYANLFTIYEKYLESLKADNEKVFLNTYESEFLASLLTNIKNTIQRCGDIEQFEPAFTSVALTELINVILVMRSFNIDFFDELLEIEQTCTIHLTDLNLMNRIMNMPLHVRLLVLECSIVNRRGITNFLELILKQVFLPKSKGDGDPDLSVTVAAYTIEMLSRHGVGLSFDMNGNSVLQYLGNKIFAAVKQWKCSHLKEVLMVLCAALRLNPLILEENIFEITVMIMLAPKSGDVTERQLFEEYLVLLMDMFRRLSRAEKFVANLLKALKEFTKTGCSNLTRKRKNNNLTEDTPTKKKVKTTAGETAVDFAVSFKYLNVLFQDFFKPVLSQIKSRNNTPLSTAVSFPKLLDIWPSNPVGVSFSKTITGLVSKPSLVIWKTLLFAFKELIATFKYEEDLSETSLFLLDFHTALLTQYFTGCKLAEQSDKFVDDIATQLQFTSEILQAFGKCLLDREHNARTMAAFLEISFYSTNFELMLSYYRPDGCNHENLMSTKTLGRLHSFLTPDEWTLIRQRVLNFGKSNCKYLLQRLDLQKAHSHILLLAKDMPPQIKSLLNSADKDTINALLKDVNVRWLLSQIPRNEKASIAAHILCTNESIELIQEDLDLLELTSVAIYENISTCISSKHCLLNSLQCDYDKIRSSTNASEYEMLIKQLVDILTKKYVEDSSVTQIDSNKIKSYLDLLSKIPLGHLRRQGKTIIFVLHLSLYRTLKSARDEILTAQTMDILKDLLHFGQQVLIFKYFPTSCLLKLLPAENCWDLYDFLFSTLKNEEKGTDQFLQGLTEILQESVTQQTLNDSQRKLLLAAIDSLSSLTGPCAKRFRKYLDIFLNIFSNFLASHFNNAKTDGTSKKDKKFVQKTLSGFAPYASAVLTKVSKEKDADERDVKACSERQITQAMDEDFRRICKIYIGHSMDYQNPSALRLMHVALNHRELLHLDQDEIEFVLTNYWSQINEDLHYEEQHQQYQKAMESAIKMIIGNKTNEDLLITLKSMADNFETSKLVSKLRLLGLIANCPFSTIKGAIFNEQYKQITFNITLLLSRDDHKQFRDHNLVLNLLRCHQAILDNKMVPISIDTVDSLLSFLMDINIKKFNLYERNLRDFNSLHMAMSDVCSSLVKHRHILLSDRVPQYMYVYKDLVQSIVWYKSDRTKDTALSSEELDTLSELAMKLESLMHLIAPHSVVFKRVAPFVLTFIINLMVAKKRPTTLYNKVKTHIQNICYELVGICDHRVGRFILRCSNDAGRQMYELMVKDYQKYYKFKGKI